MAKDPDKLYKLLESVAKESEDHTQLPSLSELAKMQGWSRNTVAKICEEDSRFKEVTKNKFDSGKKFIPSKMDTSLFTIGGGFNDLVEKARSRLKLRIFREPTIDEILEEMGREPDYTLRDRVRKSVSKKWRDPSKQRKKNAEKELQNMIEEAYPVFLSWTKTQAEPEGKIRKYIQNNLDCFQDMEIKNKKKLDSGSEKLWVSAPPKLGKFMEDPDFTIKVNPRDKS